MDSSWLVGGGEMGRHVRSMDWSQSALGPIEGWPQSLRTTVGLCLASNFPISMAWGPSHIQIYNDGYWPICGAKHPQAMGMDFTECWASAWPAIGDSFERALTGETSFLENVRMFLDRNGYLEETFFTFSFSPIRDETGGIAGLFHPVTETTAEMIGERRTRALRDLAAGAGRAETTIDALRQAAQSLEEFSLDIPFALFYVIGPDGATGRLVARNGSLPDVLAAEQVDLASPAFSRWPLHEVLLQGKTVQVDGVAQFIGAAACGPYPESPKTALVIPILPPGCARAVAVLIVGASSRLPLNETYRSFVDLVAAGITSAVANARAHEAQLERAEALAAIDRAKTEFFTNVSHEFRTPLTLMLGPLEDELAEISGALPAARLARLETAHRNALRLLKLVNSLLDFSRVESDRIQASYQATDLAAFTAELASVFRSAMEKAGLTFTVDCPPLPELIYLDREMWEKIVLNLLSNAFKHTFEGGIRVSVAWRDDHPELLVADTGVGIAADELPHLFDRFHRVKGARSRSHEGTGIGLALVQQLVQVHGGAIDVVSSETRGSTFTVSMQAGRNHLPPDRIKAPSSEAPPGSRTVAYAEEALLWLANQTPQSPAEWRVADAGVAAAGDSRPRILLVDDNADMRDYIRRLLEPHYDVTTMPDGRAAVTSALAAPPGLVLTDVMMPGLDGFGVLRELRADPRTRFIPVILLSARAGEEAAVEGMDAGADDYLVKPFAARELMARVRTHLQLARQRRQWERELEDQAADLAAAYRELEAFSYSVSHDLKAPLRAIDGFAQMLEEDFSAALNDEGRRVIATIRGNSRHMGELIAGLLEFSKAGRGEVRRQDTDTQALAQAAVVEARLGYVGPEPIFEISALPRVNADAMLLRQVWCNLIGNALKYSAKRNPPRIKVSGRVENGEAIYQVEDNGAGFDMRYAEKLFGVFQRLHRAEEFAGTGVGLAIAHRIVSRHGGRIWAQGSVGSGACFQFALPI